MNDGPRSASSTSGTSLRRSVSNRSDYSSSDFALNSNASRSSVASTESGVSSTASSTSSRGARRIIPLYNLQAHNVLTNVIADAGTDAKIAKFQKKGLELIDLAVLEPVEVWGTRNRSGEKEAKKQGMKISVDEMGSVVHTGEGVQTSSKISKTLIQPQLQASTVSANSSAASLNTSSSQPHGPQLVVSPPSRGGSAPQQPPASAPPSSGTFPPVSLPSSEARKPPDAPGGLADHEDEPPASPGTPVKKTLFGKFKFGKRTSQIVQPIPSSPDASSLQSPPSASPSIPETPEYQPTLLRKSSVKHRPPTIEGNGHGPAAPTLLAPPSVSPGSSNTPTPTQATPNPSASHPSTEDTENAQNQTPHGAPTPETPSQQPLAASKRDSFGFSLARGRAKLISGIKTAAIAPIAESQPSPANNSPRAVPPSLAENAGGQTTVSGAKGFFNKLAAGISGDRNGAPSRLSLGSRDAGATRESFDSHSSTSRVGGFAGRFLHHSSSQQFIGTRGTPTASGSSSANPSPRPSYDQTMGSGGLQVNALQATVSGGSTNASVNGPLTPSSLQSFLPAQTASGQTLQLHQLSLRQLQLRPPVLGIQPTYVSASSSSPTYSPPQDPRDGRTSALSLNAPRTSEEGMGNANGGPSGVPLTKVESISSLGATEESELEAGREEIKSSPKRRRRESRTDSSFVNAGSSTAALSIASSAPPSRDKERALMYVWMVAKWMKKRNGQEGLLGHLQSASEVANGVGRGARDLLHNILPGREKERGGVNGVQQMEKEMKRGSWHAGAGVGLTLPNISALGSSHSAQPSLSSAGAGGSSGLVLGPIVGAGFEVRFEWKRAKAKRKKGSKERKDDEAEANKRGRGKVKGRQVKERDMAKEEGLMENDDTPKISQGNIVEQSPRKMTLAERKRLNRASTASVSSLGEEKEITRDRSVGGSASPSRRRRISLSLKKDEEQEEDDDEDSDSEDSETPWVCTLKIRRVAHVLKQQQGGSTAGVGVLSLGSESSKKSDNEQLRLRVGTLSPTPHHPKVVAMLKVPFPLPDVEVERMEVVKRPVYGMNGTGESEQEKEPYLGLTLTAEDIKDVVCCTGLWLVVREGFGGVGKVNRKGDGWKIRG